MARRRRETQFGDERDVVRRSVRTRGGASDSRRRDRRQVSNRVDVVDTFEQIAARLAAPGPARYGGPALAARGRLPGIQVPSGFHPLDGVHAPGDIIAGAADLRVPG